MRVLLFAASRVFGESAEGYRWAQDQISLLLLGRYELILTAGTPGPEVWMEAAALRWGIPTVVFHADGRRTDSRGRGPSRWCPKHLKASARLRDDAIAQAAIKATRAGVGLTCVGLLDAESERSGTAYRLGLLEGAGLPVHRLLWAPATTTEEAAPVAAE